MPVHPFQNWAPFLAAKLMLLPDVPGRLERRSREVFEHLWCFVYRGFDVDFGRTYCLILQWRIIDNVLILGCCLLGDIFFAVLFLL